jgi:ketosteroid isomerase-like protein
LARELFEAYGRSDLAAVGATLADDLVAYVTSSDGDVDVVEGRDRYLERLPDLRAASGRLDVTQVVEIDPERVLTMVEIHARRKDRDLHNVAAFLARVEDGRVRSSGWSRRSRNTAPSSGPRAVDFFGDLYSALTRGLAEGRRPLSSAGWRATRPQVVCRSGTQPPGRVPPRVSGPP